jgi:hypothetical protein
MAECRYCQRTFQASRFHPEQRVCGDEACQCWRRAESRQRKLETDALYRQTARDSPQKWRRRHGAYWKRYREKNPEAVKRNRELQRGRDARRRLAHLAKNNAAIDVKSMVSEVWWAGPRARDLANNNLARAKVFIYQPQGP